MKRSSFTLLVAMTSIWLVAGCSRTAPPPVANLDEGPPTKQDEETIRNQIIPCWKLPTGIDHPENYPVSIQIDVTPDGRVEQWKLDGELWQLSDPTYLAVMQQAVNAVNDQSCQPLRFPPGKYWPRITVVFDPKKIHG